MLNKVNVATTYKVNWQVGYNCKGAINSGKIKGDWQAVASLQVSSSWNDATVHVLAKLREVSVKRTWSVNLLNLSAFQPQIRYHPRKGKRESGLSPVRTIPATVLQFQTLWSEAVTHPPTLGRRAVVRRKPPTAVTRVDRLPAVELTVEVPELPMTRRAAMVNGKSHWQGATFRC